MRALDALGEPRGINDAGQVLGSSSLAGSANDSFITAPDGVGVTDLNSLFDLPEGVILYRAIDINNNGQVIATGIPAPETYAVTARNMFFTARYAKFPLLHGRVPV